MYEYYKCKGKGLLMEGPIMRSLPQSLEAEQSVIGSMIIDKEAISKALEKLNEEDFYRDGHKVIFKAIREMYSRRYGC